MQAIEKDYTAWRSIPWGGSSGDVAIIIVGEDWTGYTFAWKFALNEGAAASFTLSSVSAGSQGVVVSYDAGYLDPETSAVVGATTIIPQIDEATHEGLTFDGTKPLEMFHTFYVTPTGQLQQIERYGKYTIRQGVQD